MTLGVLALAACSSGGPPISTMSGSGSESSSDGPDLTTVDPTIDPTSGVTPVGTTGPDTADSGSQGTDTGPTDTGPTDTGCPPGTEGCPCDADSCAGDLICAGDTCLAVPCDPDVFEPNDDEQSAYDLGDITSSDGDASVVSGSLQHPGDVDWYRYHGEDVISGNVDPARDLVAAGQVRLCKFLECDNGLNETQFECPANTQYALSPMARPGCCLTSDMNDVTLPDLNCTGVTGDDAVVYLRVDQSTDTCISYSVSYHY